MLSCFAAAAKSRQSCPTLCDPIDGSPPGSCPWDSPGKNTGVGCHFLLQCMKVKSVSEVSQSCPTLRDLMDCSLPGSSVHAVFQARGLEWVPLPSLLSCFSHAQFFVTPWTTRILCPWDSPGKNTRVGCHALLQGLFLTRALNLGLLCCRWILYC